MLTGGWSDSTGTGTLVFTLSADGNLFTGTWKRVTGNGNSSGSWNGVRVSSSAPAINVSPASLSFGTIALGQNKDLTLDVANKGTGALVVSRISSDSAVFVPTTSSLTVAPGLSATLVVRFSPATPGAQVGTLSLVSNDTLKPSATVSLTGAGVAAMAGDVVLKVDGGTFAGALGFPGGGGIFVNRLTPPSYPATLKSVQMFFGNRSSGLPQNTDILLISASNPSGSATISQGAASTVQQALAKVNSLGGFNSYSVTPITIPSGDFIVGFGALTGDYPADLDNSTPSQKRSYTSGDAVNFSLIDNFGSSTAGNLAIRAVVTLGAAGSTITMESTGSAHK